MGFLEKMSENFNLRRHFPEICKQKLAPVNFNRITLWSMFLSSLETDKFFSSKLVETYIFRWTTQILTTSSVNFVRISHADRYEVKFSHDQCGKRVKIIRSETRPNDKYEQLMTLKNFVMLKHYEQYVKNITQIYHYYQIYCRLKIWKIWKIALKMDILRRKRHTLQVGP